MSRLPSQGVIHNLPDLAQRVFGWDAFFKVDITEQRSALLIRPAHPDPRRYPAESKSCSLNRVEGRLIQHPVKDGALSRHWSERQWLRAA